jgi:hypothetical protein
VAGSATDAHYKGFIHALDALFDLAIATDQGPRGRQAATVARRKLALLQDFSAVRQALDEAPDNLPMGRSMAMFFLHMSPAVFQRHLKEGPHPFASDQHPPSKGEVNAWFTALMGAKHALTLQIEPLRLGRDNKNGRRYLLDASGAILADAEISSINTQDALYAIEHGGSIRILRLDEALVSPWADPLERAGWAAGWTRWLNHRRDALTTELAATTKALSQAQDQDLQSTTGPAKPSTKRSEGQL